MELWELFEDLYAQGNTIILVTHEEDIAEHARRVVRLRDGLLESDAPVANPRLATATGMTVDAAPLTAFLMLMTASQASH